MSIMTEQEALELFANLSAKWNRNKPEPLAAPEKKPKLFPAVGSGTRRHVPVRQADGPTDTPTFLASASRKGRR